MDKRVQNVQHIRSDVIVKRDARESTIRQRNMSSKTQEMEEVESEDKKKEKDENEEEKTTDDENTESDQELSDHENIESDQESVEDYNDEQDEKQEKSSSTTKKAIVYTDKEKSWTKADILQLIKDNDSKPDDLSFPAGALRYVQSGNSFIVTTTSRAIKYYSNKGFTCKQNGGVRNAFQLALAHRNDESDRLGLTKSLHKCFTTPLSLDLQQYFSGLIDGDGCIFASRSSVRVSLGASTGSTVDHPEVMKLLEKSYGGKIKNCGKAKAQHRNGWKYHLYNRSTQILLQHMKDHSIIKQREAELALNFVKDLPLITRKDPTRAPRRAELKKKLAQLKKEYATVKIDLTKLTIPYLAGFTDAEGCIHMQANGRLRFSVCQKQCPRILAALIKKFDCGSSDNSDWYMYNQRAINMLHQLDPYLIIKKSQSQLILNNLDLLPKTNGKKRKLDATLKGKIHELVLTCKKLKKE